jgi:hypothetical protein
MSRVSIEAALSVAEVAEAKECLRAKGWTWRSAADELGYSYTHVAHTLTNRRYSRRFLEAIKALPDRKAKALGRLSLLDEENSADNARVVTAEPLPNRYHAYTHDVEGNLVRLG